MVNTTMNEQYWIPLGKILILHTHSHILKKHLPSPQAKPKMVERRITKNYKINKKNSKTSYIQRL